VADGIKEKEVNSVEMMGLREAADWEKVTDNGTGFG
jgi:hypothetical protein